MYNTVISRRCYIFDAYDKFSVLLKKKSHIFHIFFKLILKIQNYFWNFNIQKHDFGLDFQVSVLHYFIISIVNYKLLFMLLNKNDT